MKKIVVILVILSLALTWSGIALAEESGSGASVSPVSSSGEPLEKISSPEEIKLFEKIKKIGTALFGLRKNVASQNATVTSVSSAGSSSDSENINIFTSLLSAVQSQEKISSPEEIKNYEKIKKIGTSLFGIRKEKSSKANYIKPEYASCVKAAMTKRTISLKSAIGTHDSANISALDTRTACELASLDKTTAQEQYDANKLCIETDKKSKELNESTFNKAKEEAQKTFQSAVKQCLNVQIVTTSSTSTITSSSSRELLEDNIELEDNHQ